jgi:hypothetical protein
MAVVVVVSTEEASAVGVSAVAVLVVGSTEEASAVVVSVGDVSAVALSTVIRGGGTGAIRMDITVTTITRTVTIDTDIHTVTTVGPVSDTALAADQGISELGDKPDYGCSAPRVEPNNFRYRDGYLESVLAGRTKGRHAVKRDGLLWNGVEAAVSAACFIGPSAWHKRRYIIAALLICWRLTCGAGLSTSR